MTSYKLPKYTLTLTNTELGKEMSIGCDSIDGFMEKGISGTRHYYVLLELFKEKEKEVLSENSSNITK